MKILFISNLYPPYFLGGYELLCETVCSGLSGKGHSVSVLTSTHGVEEGQPRDDGRVLRKLALYAPFSRPAGIERFNRMKTFLKNYRITHRVLDDLRPDIVFVWSQLRLTLASARAAQDMGLPCVFTFNDDHITGYRSPQFGMSPRAAYRYLLDRLLFARNTVHGLDLSCSTCISQALKRQIISRGVDIRASRVIYQGIPLELFPMKEMPASLHDPLRILYVGQLHEYKGVHTLLEAGEILSRNLSGQVSLNIVGSGDDDYRTRLEQLARRPALRGRVSFISRMPRNRLSGLYQESDIFVFPSIWDEPFGMTHLEAMASGTPVISTTGGGPGEFIEHEKNALAFPAGDSKALAERIASLAREPGLRTQIVIRARKLVEDKFSLDGYVSSLEKFLDESLERSGSMAYRLSLAHSTPAR